MTEVVEKNRVRQVPANAPAGGVAQEIVSTPPAEGSQFTSEATLKAPVVDRALGNNYAARIQQDEVQKAALIEQFQQKLDELGEIGKSKKSFGEDISESEQQLRGEIVQIVSAFVNADDIFVTEKNNDHEYDPTIWERFKDIFINDSHSTLTSDAIWPRLAEVDGRLVDIPAELNALLGNMETDQFIEKTRETLGDIMTVSTLAAIERGEAFVRAYEAELGDASGNALQKILLLNADEMGVPRQLEEQYYNNPDYKEYDAKAIRTRIAEFRKKFELAKEYLKEGDRNAANAEFSSVVGSNPFKLLSETVSAHSTTDQMARFRTSLAIIVASGFLCELTAGYVGAVFKASTLETMSGRAAHTFVTGAARASSFTAASKVGHGVLLQEKIYDTDKSALENLGEFGKEVIYTAGMFKAIGSTMRVATETVGGVLLRNAARSLIKSGRLSEAALATAEGRTMVAEVAALSAGGKLILATGTFGLEVGAFQTWEYTRQTLDNLLSDIKRDPESAYREESAGEAAKTVLGLKIAGAFARPITGPKLEAMQEAIKTKYKPDLERLQRDINSTLDQMTRSGSPKDQNALLVQLNSILERKANLLESLADLGIDVRDELILTKRAISYLSERVNAIMSWQEDSAPSTKDNLRRWFYEAKAKAVDKVRAGVGNTFHSDEVKFVEGLGDTIANFREYPQGCANIKKGALAFGTERVKQMAAEIEVGARHHFLTGLGIMGGLLNKIPRALIEPMFARLEKTDPASRGPVLERMATLIADARVRSILTQEQIFDLSEVRTSPPDILANTVLYLHEAGFFNKYPIDDFVDRAVSELSFLSNLTDLVRAFGSEFGRLSSAKVDKLLSFFGETDIVLNERQSRSILKNIGLEKYLDLLTAVETADINGLRSFCEQLGMSGEARDAIAEKLYDLSRHVKESAEGPIGAREVSPIMELAASLAKVPLAELSRVLKIVMDNFPKEFTEKQLDGVGMLSAENSKKYLDSYNAIKQVLERCQKSVSLDEYKYLARTLAAGKVATAQGNALGAVSESEAVESILNLRKYYLEKVGREPPNQRSIQDVTIVATHRVSDEVKVDLEQGVYEAYTGLQYTLRFKVGDKIYALGSVGFLETDSNILITRFQGKDIPENVRGQICSEFKAFSGGLGPMEWLGLVATRKLKARADEQGKGLQFIRGKSVRFSYPYNNSSHSSPKWDVSGYGRETPVETMAEGQRLWDDPPPKLAADAAEYKRIKEELKQAGAEGDANKVFKLEARLGKFPKKVVLFSRGKHIEAMYDMTSNMLGFKDIKGAERREFRKPAEEIGKRMKNRATDPERLDATLSDAGIALDMPEYK